MPDEATGSTTVSRERQVRVFISSTFRDMHAERDHLVTVVFPELRERVEQLGLEFFDVDLRWGVPAKDANGETANSWEYCRQWIDRVEPFFVCILGQRYGWVPKVEDFRDEADQAKQKLEPRSITDLEVRHAVLDSHRKRRSYFYLRATPVPEPNTEYVDPPEYQDRLEQLKTAVRQCGRPVRNYSPEWTGQGFVGLKEFGDFVLEDLWSGVLRDERYVSKDVWRQVLAADPDTDPRYTDESQPVPRELWEKIVKLARPAPVSPLDAERQQMEAFAASRLRWFQGRSDELQQLTDFLHATAVDAPRLAVVAAVPGQGKSALIAKLHQQLSELPQADKTRRNNNQTRVTTDFTDDSDHTPESAISVPSAVESVFLITHFVGATERSATAHALVERLLGELDRSGIEWPADEQKKGEEPKRDFNSLCHRLAKRLGDYAGERRIVILLDALNQLTDGHNLVWLPHRLGSSVRVIISCVDDSVGGPRSVVDETLKQTDARDRVPPEQQVLRALASRQPAPLRVPLAPLTETDVRTIVVEYLKEYCHELDREHLDTLCAIPQARNPLYLLVMLNELRTLGGNDLNVIVPARIAAMPHDHPDTVSLFRWVLQRLEVFGPEAVRWWCMYLAHGRVGMASHELADLLARKLGANAAATALLIERGLRRYLLRRGGQLDFFHSQLRQAVVEQYGSHVEATTVHVDIADYFETRWSEPCVRALSELPYHLQWAEQWERLVQILSDYEFVEAKVASGLIFILLRDYADVERTSSAGHLDANQKGRVQEWHNFLSVSLDKLLRGQEPFLQIAYNHARSGPVAEAVAYRGREVRNPTFQSALGRNVRRTIDQHLWFKLLNRPIRLEATGPTLNQRFALGGDVDLVALNPNGDLIAACTTSGLIAVCDRLSGSYLLKKELCQDGLSTLRWFGDRWLGALDTSGRLWVFHVFAQSERGVLQRVCLNVAFPTDVPEKKVERITADESGERVGIAYSDGKHSVWRLDTRDHLFTFTADRPASGIQFQRGSRHTAWCFDADEDHPNCRIEFRDGTDGTLKNVLTFPARKWAIVDAATAGDRAFVFDRIKEEIAVFDISTGTEPLYLRKDVQEPVEFTADGQHIVSSSNIVLHAKDGSIAGNLSGGVQNVGCLQRYWMPQDGRFLVTTCTGYPNRPELQIHDLHSPTQEGCFSTVPIKLAGEAEDPVSWVDLNRDGRWLVLGFRDSVEIWDCRGEVGYRQPGHDGTVTAVALLNNGRLALSGAWVSHVGAGYQGYRTWESDPTHPGFRGFRVWDSNTGDLLDQEDGGVGDVATTAGGTFFAMGWESLWCLQKTHAGIWTGQGKHLAYFCHEDCGVRQVCLRPDGTRLLTYGRNDYPLGRTPGKLRLWDKNSKTPVVEIPLYANLSPRLRTSPDRKWFASWVPALPDFREELFAKLDAIESWIVTKFHNGGEPPLLNASTDESLRRRLIVWDWGTGKKAGEAVVVANGVNDVEFLMDGVHLATCGCKEGAVCLWRVPYMECVTDIQTDCEEFKSLCPHPDGTRLLAGGDTYIYVIDLNTLRVAGKWRTPAQALRISMDGLYVFADTGEHIWMLDAANGKPLGIVSCHQKTCWVIGYPNKLMIGYKSGGVEIYEIENAAFSMRMADVRSRD